MKITDIETIVVAKPDLDLTAADATQDALIVRVTTDEGIVGYGEANHNPEAIRAYIQSRGSHSWSRGIKDLLIGQDPLDPVALWPRLYRETVMSGRRGLGVAALAAIDVALWDIRGKAEGKPIYELLGGVAGPVVPYASIYAGPMSWERSLDEHARLVDHARRLGFRALKLEALVDCVPTNDNVIDWVAHLSKFSGDAKLMVDVGHRFESSAQALHYAKALAEFDTYFLETPLWLDDVEGYRELSAASPIKIAIGELFVTRNEFREMLDAGVAVVQPCVARVGVTETLAVAADAAARDALVVPYGWVATTIAVMANVHVAAALGHSPYVEFCPVEVYPGQELRRNLAGPEPRLADGEFVLPTAPGLGVEVDEEALAYYRVA
jgi:L-alanine-DL-glutamate epimerase-like enolase superfamily enzyme